MIRFLNGPAANQTLALRCAPVMLRVVCGRDGTWDALDQLDDVARPSEAIHVYKLTRPPTVVFVRASSRSMSGAFAMAAYRHFTEQLDDATVRDNASWDAWCDANKDRLMPEWAKGRAE